jgi:acyl-CoA dehydrogenase
MYQFRSELQNSLTPEQLLLQESFSKFVEKEVTPYANKWYFEDKQTDKALYKKMGDAGYLVTWADPKYGGSGLGFIEGWIIANEFQRRGYGSMEPYLHSDIVAPYFRKFGSEELNAKYMPDFIKGNKILAVCMTEPDFGSDIGSAQTTAFKDGDDYIVNGTKTFISNGLIADVFVVLVRTDPDPAARHKGLSILVVDTTESEGVIRKRLDKVGMQHLDLAEITFDNVRVPQSNLLGVEGKGFGYVMTGLQQERLFAASGYLVSSELAISEAVKYAKSRKVFGYPLSAMQNTEFKLAEMAANVLAQRKLVEDLIIAHAKGTDISVEVAAAKMITSDYCQEVVGACLQIHGGYGYMTEYPIARLFMDARCFTLAAGTSEVMKMVVGKALFA